MIKLIISTMIAFLVMLNPFAMFLYLQPIMKELKHKSFLKVLFRASAISFAILLLFLISGEFLFEEVLQIRFESFRIFGGIIIFSFAYFFIVKGQLSLVHMKEDLDDLAAEIALPFMVGAGTISLTFLMAYEFTLLPGTFLLVAVLVINFVFIILLKYIRDHLPGRKLPVAFDKNMEVFMRLNGFFLGAIGINMIVMGLDHLYF
ncbi:MAG: MarC family protein [Candidatus Woesearchaeota archaeon]